MESEVNNSDHLNGLQFNLLRNSNCLVILPGLTFLNKSFDQIDEEIFHLTSYDYFVCKCIQHIHPSRQLRLVYDSIKQIILSMKSPWLGIYLLWIDNHQMRNHHVD